MKILITGGTGTLGRHLVQECLQRGHEPVVFSRSSSHQIGLPCATFTGDVSCQEEIAYAVRSLGVTALIHAAANKHIHRCESNPSQAIQQNVVGTANVLRVARCSPSITHALVISSDKACDPSSVYGMTKLLGEKEAVASAVVRPEKQINAVRFGNLAGSSGSVIRIWEQQLQRGEIPTLHVNADGSDILKFMLLPSAAARFCLEALTAEVTGQILVKRCRVYSIRHLLEATASGYRVNTCSSYEKRAEALYSAAESTRVCPWGDDLMLSPQSPEKPATGPYDVYSTPPESAAETQQLLTAERAERLT